MMMKKEIDFKGIVQEFIDKNEKVAFIPADYWATSCINNYQTNTNRRNWHIACEELEVYHLTLRIWSYIDLCGSHRKPLIGLKCYSTGQYDSDYECDDCGGEEYCYREDEPVKSKMRKVIIFNKEAREKIRGLDDNQIRDYLVSEGILEKKDGKYWVFS